MLPTTGDLAAKASRCLAVLLPVTEHAPALQALVGVPGLPAAALDGALARRAAVLGAGPAALELRKAFLVTGGLRLVQALPRPSGGGAGGGGGGDADREELIGAIVALYPPDVAAYYRPGYATRVLAERLPDE